MITIYNFLQTTLATLVSLVSLVVLVKAVHLALTEQEE